MKKENHYREIGKMKIKKRLVLFLMLFMLVYGLSNVQEYGRPTDEKTEIWILKTNILEYARLFLPENSNSLAKIQKQA